MDNNKFSKLINHIIIILISANREKNFPCRKSLGRREWSGVTEELKFGLSLQDKTEATVEKERLSMMDSYIR